jgi:hypothetical protein
VITRSHRRHRNSARLSPFGLFFFSFFFISLLTQSFVLPRPRCVFTLSHVPAAPCQPGLKSSVKSPDRPPVPSGGLTPAGRNPLSGLTSPPSKSHRAPRSTLHALTALPRLTLPSASAASSYLTPHPVCPLLPVTALTAPPNTATRPKPSGRVTQPTSQRPGSPPFPSRTPSSRCIKLPAQLPPASPCPTRPILTRSWHPRFGQQR